MSIPTAEDKATSAGQPDLQEAPERRKDYPEQGEMPWWGWSENRKQADNLTYTLQATFFYPN